MKKLFKRSLACIIAVVMIATSLPFSAITANADTTANSSITMNAFGAFKNGTASRVGGDYVSICNDGQSSNFVMAVFKFNISGLTVDDSMTISAKFKYYLQLTESENKGVSFYYPTQHLDEFNIADKYQDQPNSSIWTTDDGNHLSRAIGYYGLQALATNISISNTKSTGDLEIGSSILESKKQGKSYAVVVGVIASAGQSGQTGGWTDTKIGYESTNVDVAVTTSERDYTFAEVQSALASFSAYYPSAYGSFTGDDSFTNYEDHYKGLVYAEDVKDYSATGSVLLGSKYVIGIGGSTSNYSNLYFPTSVALYTGSNEITVPIMISTSTAASGTWKSNYRPHAGVISGDGLSLVNGNWNGYDEKGNTWKANQPFVNSNQTKYLPPLNFMWTINQESYTLNTTASQGKNENIYAENGDKARIFANKVKVTPSFDSDTTVTSKSYTPSIRFYVSAGDESFDSNKYIDLTSSDAVTVINYQPYLNKLATVKSDIAKMKEANYTAETLSPYVKACSRFLNLNPSLYTYSKDSATATAKLIEDLNSAMSAYDTAKANLESIDTSALDDAKTQAKDILDKGNADGKYVADTYQKLSVVYDRIKNVVPTSQEHVNSLTSELLTAISNLVQAKFNVVFVTVGLDSTTENEKFNDYIEYGETYNADAGANVKKWVVTTDNGNTSTVIDNFDQKASFVITKDAKIYAYLSGEDSSTTSSKVTFLGRHNQVVAIRYVAEGMTLDTTKVDAPSIPFYHFENWDVASVIGNGNEYTVKASYTCNQASSDFCTVHFGEWSKPYAYDSYVYLPNTVSGTKYALYSDKKCTKLLTILDGVDFYAPKTSDIYVKAYDAEEKAIIAVTGSFAEKDEEKGKNYANFNCKFYLPADAKAIEWGVEVLSTDGTRTAKVKAENLSKRNEYTVRFGTAIGSSVPSIKGRAYLVYEQNGEKKTIYSSDESDDESDKYVTVNLNA